MSHTTYVSDRVDVFRAAVNPVKDLVREKSRIEHTNLRDLERSGTSSANNTQTGTTLERKSCGNLRKFPVPTSSANNTQTGEAGNFGGAAAAILEIQLCKIVQSSKLEWTNFKRRLSWTPTLPLGAGLGSTCEWL